MLYFIISSTILGHLKVHSFRYVLACVLKSLFETFEKDFQLILLVFTLQLPNPSKLERVVSLTHEWLAKGPTKILESVCLMRTCKGGNDQGLVSVPIDTHFHKWGNIQMYQNRNNYVIVFYEAHVFKDIWWMEARSNNLCNQASRAQASLRSNQHL